MSDDASPYFIRPHRFDQSDQDDRGYPKLDRHRRVVLDPAERALWRGRVDVSGYLLGPSLGNGTLHWSLLRPADLTVTDRRLAFVCEDWEFEEVGAAGHAGTGRSGHHRSPKRIGSRIVSGQIRWQWPGRLHLLPAEAGPDNQPGRPEQVLLVCDSLRTIRQPGLALGAGDLGPHGAARELTHLIRRSIARFRLAHPGTPEMSPRERDRLSVHAGAGLFAEELADPWRGVNLPGALVVEFTHRDDYHRRSVRSSFSARRTPSAGSSGLWHSGNPGSAS
jgi:hypothetical protein